MEGASQGLISFSRIGLRERLQETPCMAFTLQISMGVLCRFSLKLREVHG